MPIASFMDDRVFGPRDIKAVSLALEDICKILNLADEAKSERELVAKKIVALAHQSERNAALLRDRMLREIASGRDEWPVALVRSARHGALLSTEPTTPRRG